MAIYSLTGNDTLVLSTGIVDDYADGSTINITFNNDRIGTSTGKNNNTIISDNRQGANATLELRLIRGGKTDKKLNALSLAQDKDLPTFELIDGTFAKRIGDGLGKVTFDNYVLQGGAFQRYPDVQENLNGETEQGVVVYTIFFSQVQRGLA